MIKVQVALEKDIPAFLEIEGNKDTKEFIIPYNFDRHVSEFRQDNVIYLSIVERQMILGFMILLLEPDGQSVEFRRIVVSKKGKGTGQKAITELEHFCKTELSRKRIWLDVFEFNKRGIHIYKKLGYKYYKTKKYNGKRLFFFEKDL